MRSFPLAVSAFLLCSLAPASTWAQLESPLTLNVDSNGMLRRERKLTVSPATLRFGKVRIGETASLRVTFTASAGAVTILSDEFNSPEFSIIGLTLPVKIPAGKSIEATIQFRPTSSGRTAAQAEFISNAEGSPTLEGLLGIAAAPPPHQVDLTWEPGDGNAIGYNIYRGFAQGGPYEQINDTLDSSASYTDYAVVGGDTYYYVATEVNNQGEQSGYSNEVGVTIPTN